MIRHYSNIEMTTSNIPEKYFPIDKEACRWTEEIFFP